MPSVPAPRPPASEESTRPFRHPGAALTQPAPAPTAPTPAPARPRPPVEEGPATRVEPRTVEPAKPPVAEAAPTRPAPKPAPTEPRPAEKPSRPAGPATRRLVRISPRSVFRVALALYLGVLATVVAATTGLWILLEASGAIENIESFMGELLGYEDFKFLFGRIFLVMTLLGLVWVVISATVTALLAALYNRAARFTGGVRVVVEDEG